MYSSLNLIIIEVQGPQTLGEKNEEAASCTGIRTPVSFELQKSGYKDEKSNE